MCDDNVCNVCQCNDNTEILLLLLMCVCENIIIM